MPFEYFSKKWLADAISEGMRKMRAALLLVEKPDLHKPEKIAFLVKEMDRDLKTADADFAAIAQLIPDTTGPDGFPATLHDRSLDELNGLEHALTALQDRLLKIAEEGTWLERITQEARGASAQEAVHELRTRKPGERTDIHDPQVRQELEALRKALGRSAAPAGEITEETAIRRRWLQSNESVIADAAGWASSFGARDAAESWVSGILEDVKTAIESKSRR